MQRDCLRKTIIIAVIIICVCSYSACSSLASPIFFTLRPTSLTVSKQPLGLSDNTFNSEELFIATDEDGNFLIDSNKDDYEAGFLFFDDYDRMKGVPGTPQNLLQLIVDIRSFGSKGSFSEIVIVMDKDGTASRVNEVVDGSMLDRIIEALRLDAKLVICTGGMLMHSVDNFIEPLEKRIKEAGLWNKYANLAYFFMSGVGKISWDENGNRKITYLESGFTSEVQLVIAKNLAKAFIKKVKSAIHGLKSAEEILTVISGTKSLQQVVQIFNDFVTRNKNFLGHVEINHALGKQFTLELKVSLNKQASLALQNIEFTRAVNAEFVRLMSGVSGFSDMIIHYGETYVDVSFIDKKMTLLRYLNEEGFSNPLVIAIGDGRNDYGFLGSDITQGRKLSFFVGRDYMDIPGNVIIWPEKGPSGTEEILGLINSVIGGHVVRIGVIGNKDLYFGNKIANAVMMSA